jgi:hypothetical protein
MTNETNRDAMPQDEQRFREIGDRFVHCADPMEADRLKRELVRTLLWGRPGRQQYAMREWARTIGER